MGTMPELWADGFFKAGYEQDKYAVLDWIKNSLQCGDNRGFRMEYPVDKGTAREVFTAMGDTEGIYQWAKHNISSDLLAQVIVLVEQYIETDGSVEDDDPTIAGFLSFCRNNTEIWEGWEDE